MNRLKTFIRITFLLFSLNIITQPGSSQYPGTFSDKIKVTEKIPVKAYAFNLADVRLLESPFLENMKRDGRWLLSISTDRLLHNYRVNAGLASKAKAFGGWEGLDVELRGHSLGHVLSGLALMYASTGNTAFKLKGDTIVSALGECQDALNRNGYISAFPEYLIDRAITGKPVWAPWYTLHKIYAGLLDMYLYTGSDKALEILTKASTWAFGKIGNLTPEQLATMQKTEFGGMNEVMYNLYAVTGNPEHKKLAECFYHNSIMDPLAAGQDRLSGLHANTQIPKITGAARGYELTGDGTLKTIAEFFWKTVTDYHTYANGGNSEGEYFFDRGTMSSHLSPYTTETCNTYNMLKLTRHLFEWTAEAGYADYYETALYNHILASQDPETGMVCYFMPLKSGMFKVYSTPDNSFWCCVGTAFESHAKYAESIYYHNDNGVFVNLFIPSELNWKEKNMKLKQETSYPESDKIILTVENAPEEALSFFIRYPSWAVSGASVRVNGKNIRVQGKPGSYINVSRRWKSGDRIEVSLPMTLRLSGIAGNPGKAAVLYGPVLLAGVMGNEGMKSPAPYAADQDDYSELPVPGDIVTELRPDRTKLNKSVVPLKDEPLAFVTSNGVASREVKLIPYYKIHNQRYVVYWDLK